MTDLSLSWGMGGFKKWRDPSNGGDEFEMRGKVDTLLKIMLWTAQFLWQKMH